MMLYVFVKECNYEECAEYAEYAEHKIYKEHKDFAEYEVQSPISPFHLADLFSPRIWSSFPKSPK